MEKARKSFVGVILLTLLSLAVVPYFNVQAQTGCNPDDLKPVSYGQRGAAVRNAQECLMEAGYDIPAGATGYYGNQTVAAVKQFYADWYGSWNGKSLGPKGIAELKKMLASSETPSPVEQTTPTTQQPTQTQSGVPSDVLMQALTLILGGKTNEAIALLTPYLGGQLPVSTQTETATTQQQTTLAPEEGFLSVDKDPTVAAVTLREGETGKVVGLRFRADNGAVVVKSVFLRWTGSAAPYRVISALKLVDSQGNVLYQTNVGQNTFLQDSSLNYYLPISGLDVTVPKNGYNSIFVEVTVVGTLPSGVNSLSFEVRQNDVRARDGVGIDRFGPSSDDLPWSATLQTSLAGNAKFVLALNPNTPKQGYVFGDTVDGRIQKVKVFSFDVAAKNDNLRVTQVAGSVTNTSTVQAVYLAQGNNLMDVRTPSASGAFTFDVTPANFTINRDQTVTFDVLVDLFAPTVPNVATFTVSVATTTGVNSLGDIFSSTSTTVTSEMMRAVRVGPRFAAVEKTISVTRDQNNSTTTVQSVVFRVNVTAVGGTLYVPSANTATITLETAAGTLSPVTVAPTAVKVGTTPVSASGGYYTVPEGSTYEFEFRTSGQTFTGSQSLRARLSSFVFDNDSAGAPMDNSSFLHNLSDFWTNWSN